MAKKKVTTAGKNLPNRKPKGSSPRRETVAVKESGSKDDPNQKFLAEDLKPPKISELDTACANHQRHESSKVDAADKVANALGEIETLMTRHKLTAYRCGPREYLLNESRRLQVKKAK